jgi:hypothetical protein
MDVRNGGARRKRWENKYPWDMCFPWVPPTWTELGLLLNEWSLNLRALAGMSFSPSLLPWRLNRESWLNYSKKSRFYLLYNLVHLFTQSGSPSSSKACRQLLKHTTHFACLVVVTGLLISPFLVTNVIESELVRRTPTVNCNKYIFSGVGWGLFVTSA